MGPAARPARRLRDGGQASRRATPAPSRSARSSAPAASGGTSRTSMPRRDEMYARMLGLSRRLGRGRRRRAEPIATALDDARRELYRGQCNCPYWHGAFGGLYLPHLRNAIYKHLIAAHDALDRAEGKAGPRVALDVADFNLDARLEARLENDRLVAFVRPATGGHVYELDVRRAGGQRPGDARPPPRVVPRRHRRGRRAPTRRRGRRGPVEPPRPGHPQAGGDRPAPRLRPLPPQGAGRPLLPARRDPRRPGRAAATSSAATSSPAPICRRPTARPAASP